MSALIGPRFPATPEERAVWADSLLAQGVNPPWPLKEKPMKIKGAVIAQRAAELMSKMATANATLAGIEEQRTKAELDLKNAQEELAAIGIDSVYDITRVEGSKEYPTCCEPNCKAVELNYWRVTDDDAKGWRCDKHRVVEPPKPPEAMPVPAPAPAATPPKKNKKSATPEVPF